jgi:hypothetical protein
LKIGQILHLKSEIGRYQIGLRIADSPIYDFEISDLRCRIRPISKWIGGEYPFKGHGGSWYTHRQAREETKGTR